MQKNIEISNFLKTKGILRSIRRATQIKLRIMRTMKNTNNANWLCFRQITFISSCILLHIVVPSRAISALGATVVKFSLSAISNIHLLRIYSIGKYGPPILFSMPPQRLVAVVEHCMISIRHAFSGVKTLLYTYTLAVVSHSGFSVLMLLPLTLRFATQHH